ncbi:cell envelope integrity protein TolA [Variovorax sp. HJSM1_2]|uniref:cell envelope integrity protein TolA n=1 Tax=Variovorax sp. HJSM1_2 TaxID=3366263 RepID=UPI003BE68105
MQATQDAVDFTPPRPKANLRALGLAIFAHLLLLAALTWGVHWKSNDTPAVEAEIWSSVTQQAAPRAVEEPVKPVEPPPQPQPEPTPPPPPRVEPKVEPPPAPKVNDADIALERDKKRKEIEKQKELEEQRQELAKQKEQERLKKIAADKKREEQKRKEEEEDRKEKAEADAKRKKAEADAKRKAEAAQEQKDKAQADAKAKEQAQARQAEALRQENLKRMQGLAGASGGANATGTALKSSGPSSSYGGRVAAKVKPNIVFPDDIAGNPAAEVEVRAAPDGTITGKRLTKSSGSKAWDDAVLRAIDKTETLPRDTDGRVPPIIIITFTPKD